MTRTAISSMLVMFSTVSFAQQSTPPQSTVAAVRAAADAWTSAARAHDGNRMGDAFADDAFVMYPQPTPTIGREANRRTWIAVFQRPNASHPITTDSIEMAASGDMAYSVGRWTSSSGEPVATTGGRYIAVWRVLNGRWLIVALSANVLSSPPIINDADK
jgi:ketosteroid isomerase-like protein